MDDGPQAQRPQRSLLVYSAGPALERSESFLRRLQDTGIDVQLRTDVDLVQEDLGEVPECGALLVLWSQFFHGPPFEYRLREISERVIKAGTVIVNDVSVLIEMQDRRWILRQMAEAGVPMPEYVVCSRDGGQQPRLEEHDDYIIVDGQRINKPFVEKPADRRDHAIYVYFPKDAGGGRALFSPVESGDLSHACRFDNAENVRREGSYIYLEYIQSEGFFVQTVCVADFLFSNAVLSSWFGQQQGASPASSAGGTGAPPCRHGQPCAVWLQQEEKIIASKLMEVFRQRIMGITFVRSQTTGRSATSFVTDVWPGLPWSGLERRCDDAVKALLADLDWADSLPSMPGWRTSLGHRSNSLPHLHMAMARSPTTCTRRSSTSSLLFLEPDDERPDAKLFCVMLLARHGDRTPKQKVKVKVTLASEFAAGWLCGWLVETSQKIPLTSNRATLELRKPDQLSRLASAFQQLQANGHEVSTLLDALNCIRKEGLSCHAKLCTDGAALAVNLKWGGELTTTGIDTAESLGWRFRCKTFPGEDIDEMHATLRHDIKIYASKSPRCQQTAAAFSKGLLHLNSPLPPIIAALVRTDELGLLDKSSQEQNNAEKASTVLPIDTPWEELEIMAGLRVPALLREFEAPRSALGVLRDRLVELQQALHADLRGCGPLYGGETHALLCERYRDALAELGPCDAPRLQKATYVLDHLQYDSHHNGTALPPAAARALEAALPLAEALCDVAVPLEAVLEQGAGSGSQVGRSILRKLRWDLRVATGASLGEETAHVKNHDALYAPATDVVRTRLYFGHNSWLLSFLGEIFGAHSACPSPEAGRTGAQLLAQRLGFLSHITVRLQRAGSETLVSCDIALGDTEESIPLFELPLEAVDTWWSKHLEEVARPW